MLFSRLITTLRIQLELEAVPTNFTCISYFIYVRKYVLTYEQMLFCERILSFLGTIRLQRQRIFLVLLHLKSHSLVRFNFARIVRILNLLRGNLRRYIVPSVFYTFSDRWNFTNITCKFLNDLIRFYVITENKLISYYRGPKRRPIMSMSRLHAAATKDLVAGRMYGVKRILDEEIGV